MPGSTPTIILIHGLWMTPLSWEHWVAHYNARGFRVLAPAWPGLEVGVESLRADPAPIAALTIPKILDHYEAIIRAEPRPPIMMGHSFGGAFVTVLADRGLGAAGVSIDGAQTKGIFKLPASTIKSAFGVLKNPLNRGKAVPFTEAQFKFAFGNLLTAEELKAAWQRYAVPAAANVLFQGALANLSRKAALAVDWGKKERTPLLLISGGKDHVVPMSMTRTIAAKYAKAGAPVEMKEYPERSHFTLAQAGWQQVADDALDWALKIANVTPPASTLET